MKILKGKFYNFGSYKDLEFDFNDLGLCIVTGPTGSGKSTLQDAAAWVLFGRTAKNGGVDEIRNWKHLDEITAGTLFIHHRGMDFEITRMRGEKHDLFWLPTGAVNVTRGKDLRDSQALLESVLGFNYEMFMVGSYFNEFGPISSFFISTAKNRRALLENVANMELAVKLGDRSILARKEIKKSLQYNDVRIQVDTAKMEESLSQLKFSKHKSLSYQQDLEMDIATTEERLKKFDTDRAEQVEDLMAAELKHDEDREGTLESLRSQLDQLKEKASKAEGSCPVCGQGLLLNKNFEKEIKTIEWDIRRIESERNPFTRDLERLAPNPYVTKLIELKSSLGSNPFQEHIQQLEATARAYELSLAKLKENQLFIQNKSDNLDMIYKLSFDLRGTLLKRSVKSIEQETNRILDKYFDSNIRVDFTIEDGDELDVSIVVNSNDSVFTQLSKGQRCLLKLCFGVAIMKQSAKTSGIHYENLFFDEALDGLDSDLKLKAVRLFAELATMHGTVMVIDHSSEIEEFFERRFLVTLSGDYSIISGG